MRLNLLLTFALAAVMGASASTPLVRATGSPFSKVKELNAAGHAMTSRASAPRKAAGEAPANAVEVPFTHGLGKDGLADIKTKYTAINANDDNRQWQYGTVNGYAGCMVPNADDIDNNDDWLITVPVHMTPGVYALSFEVGMMGSGALAVEFDAWLFSEPTLEGKLAEVAPATKATDKDFTPYEFSFTISEEGYYYIGVHCTTAKADKGTMKLANLGVRQILGEAPANTVEVPFTHGLGKDGLADIKTKYTAINANEDNRQWQYGSVSGYAACMVPNDANIDNNDDWLITVPVHMAKGNYILSFEVGMMGSGALGVEFDSWLFSEPTLEGKLAEIAPTTRATAKDFTPYEFNFAIDKEGYYYIGVHCTTAKADKGTMKLANLGVREGSAIPPVVVEPPAAGTLTYELAPKGELKATVTYVAPTKTQTGADLEEISKVVLTSRWGVDKFEYTDVKPGQTITQEVEMYQGYNNRFTAVAYAGETAGEMVEIKSIYCGIDTPLPPTDVKLTLSDDYTTATLSWTAPGEVGEHGGYVDTENLQYYIFDAFGSYYDPAIAQTDKTSITLDYSEAPSQDFYAYQVTAGVDDYYSLDEVSNIIVAGAPAQLPFIESFGEGYFEQMWMYGLESSGSNTMNCGTITDEYFASLFDPEDPDAPEPLASQDGDGGFFYWLPFDRTAVLGLVSLRADISKAANPVLEFWYQGQGSLIEVLVAAGTGDLELAKSIDLKENPVTGWTLASVSLAPYKAQGAVTFEIRLSAIHNDDDHTWSIPLDNICVRDLVPADLHIVSASIPAKAVPGQAINCTARIENFGSEAAAGATASLTVNGAVVDTKDLAETAPHGFADVAFVYTVPLNAPETLEIAITANIAGDPTPDDNTAKATATVKRQEFATVTDLAATAEDTHVTLTWTAPVNDPAQAATVFEDFESEDYTPMSISGAGEWTVYDGDGQKTYNIFREGYNPYQTAPMAFQLFNREVAEVDAYYEDAEPHSGNSFMMAPSAQSSLNDNWLISPALSGNAQTVTFWAKSAMMAWPETMEVYYSTTDNQPSSFTNKVEFAGTLIDGVLPETWTLYTVELPQGAKYFAIHHDTYDSLALLVDDVTYEGASSIPDDLAIVGYHIFRDGKQITDEPVSETTYTDEPLGADAADGDYHFEYTVVPVYNHGSVAESNKAAVDLSYSGIIDIAIDSLNEASVIYTLSGIRVAAGNVTEGVYILVNGTAARKVRLY